MNRQHIEAHVVLFTGTSSAGKIATALALQSILAAPLVYWPAEGVTLVAGAQSSDLLWLKDLEHAVDRAYFRGLAGYAQEGFITIGETCFVSAAVAGMGRDDPNRGPADGSAPDGFE